MCSILPTSSYQEKLHPLNYNSKTETALTEIQGEIFVAILLETGFEDNPS